MCLVETDDVLVTSDLQNVFYHIPVKPEHRQFLGIQWKSRYYIFNVLPFGANFSPYYFCKVVRFVVQYLRDKPCGLRLAVFVDDFLLMTHKDTLILWIGINLRVTRQQTKCLLDTMFWPETLNNFSHLHMWLHVCSPEWRDNAFLWPRSSFQQSCCSRMCTACSSSARLGNRLCVSIWQPKRTWNTGWPVSRPGTCEYLLPNQWTFRQYPMRVPQDGDLRVSTRRPQDSETSGCPSNHPMSARWQQCWWVYCHSRRN